MITSYAQNFEDVILWRALKSVKHGFYIDIGAQDPVEDSVSLSFYEQGWRGVHVEPSTLYAAKIRAARPDEEVIEAAIGLDTGLLTFYELSGTGLSTGDAAIARRHAKAGFEMKERAVPLVSLENLLDRHAEKDIHWLKVDVEGMEAGVIKSWGSSKVRPWIVVVESTFPLSTKKSHEGWQSYLGKLGYKFVYFDGLNRFYVSEEHPELKVSFGPGPNIFDEFAFPVSSNSGLLAPMRQRLEAIEEKKAEVQKRLEAANAEVTSLNAKLVTLESDIHNFEAARIAEKAAANRLHEAVTSLERHAQREAEEWRVQAKRYRDQLEEVYRSRSWRLTWPYRAIGHAVKSGRTVARAAAISVILLPRRAAAGVFSRMIRLVLTRPALKRRAIASLHTYPAILGHLQAFARSRGIIATQAIEHNPGAMNMAVSTSDPPVAGVFMGVIPERVSKRISSRSKRILEMLETRRKEYQ